MKIHDSKTRRIEFETPFGTKTVFTERIGKGQFCEAFRDGYDVYLFMNQSRFCPGKEALALWCEKSPHLPSMTNEGEVSTSSLKGVTWYTVYKTSFTEKLTAKHKTAWKQYKILKSAWENARTNLLVSKTKVLATLGKNSLREIPFSYMLEEFLEILRSCADFPSSLIDAIEDLGNAASNYGDSMYFEFSPRNLGVTEDGVLVLRDILFDREKV